MDCLASCERNISGDCRQWVTNDMIMPGALQDKHKNFDPEKGIPASRRKFNLIYMILEGFRKYLSELNPTCLNQMISLFCLKTWYMLQRMLKPARVIVSISGLSLLNNICTLYCRNNFPISTWRPAYHPCIATGEPYHSESFS